MCENAIKGIGRISRLRTPFCLAYAKTLACFRDGKLAPQAEACMHLGYSRTKPGYVLEVIEGPRKGRVITTSQVKFREDVFPMREQVWVPNMHNTLWYDISQEEESIASEDDLGIAEQDEEPDRPEDDGARSDTDSESADAPSPDSTRPRTRSNTIIDDWRAVYRENDERIYQRSQQLNTVTATVTDQRWAPKRFAQIKNMHDKAARDAWLAAHYNETDGLFAKPDVLRMIPLPDHVDAKGLLHLHTIYTVKSDGRKKARTVLGAGKDKLDTLDLGYERSFSPTARNVTVRLHCAYAAARGLIIRGGDVTQAFSQGDWPDHIKKVRFTRACPTDTTPTTTVYSIAARWGTCTGTQSRGATGT